LVSGAWLLFAGGVGVAAYTSLKAMYSEHMYSKLWMRGAPQTAANAAKPQLRTSPSPVSPAMPSTSLSTVPSTTPSITSAIKTAPVQVSLTAHQPAWVQVSADGRITFIGTLRPNETKEVSAAEQVKVLTGNAGALTISLNGKTLESLGPLGQVRVVKLTAEGPQFPPQSPPPAPDPL
jgi:hypothetical protein